MEEAKSAVEKDRGRADVDKLARLNNRRVLSLFAITHSHEFHPSKETEWHTYLEVLCHISRIDLVEIPYIALVALPAAIRNWEAAINGYQTANIQIMGTFFIFPHISFPIPCYKEAV